MVKQLLLFDKQKLRRRISLLKRKDVCLRILRLYIVRNCMNWNFISVPSVIRCTLRFFLFFLFRGDSSSPRYVKKNSQELSFIIKLRHRFSLIRKLIKRFCNYTCCPISQHFKQTDLRFSRNKEIRILLWCMDLNKTLYHIAHPLRCLVLLSLFFFSFSFAEIRQFLVVEKKQNSEDGHYFPTRENCFQVQLNFSSLQRSSWGQKKVAIVERWP